MYGNDILIRRNLKVKSVAVWEQDNVELISIGMPGVVIYFLYKPQNDIFLLPALWHGHLSNMVIGDFNSTLPPQTTMEKWLNCGQIHETSH